MYSFYHALNDPNTIVVMGSSELAFNDANRVSPQNFIPDHTNFDVLSVGRGGNQSFSVFTQLLSGKDFLKNSKIVFLVSPIWFERKMSLGTPLSSFLEYNNELFLSRIISNSDNKMFVDKLSHYVEKQYYNILSPSIPLKYFYYNSISNKSVMHDFFYAPLCFLFSSLNGPHIVLHNTDIDTAKAKLTSSNQLNPINWEKKFDDARNYTNTLSTNNNLGIENETYSLTLGNGKKRQIRMRNIDDNQEFQDFQDLIKEYSLDKVQETTTEKIKQHYDEIREANKLDLQKLTDELKVKANNFTNWYDFMFHFDKKNATHMNFLFELKLKMFDEDKVKQLPEDKKNLIRDSLNPLEIIKCLM